jgi:hypothetical protein
MKCRKKPAEYDYIRYNSIDIIEDVILFCEGRAIKHVSGSLLIYTVAGYFEAVVGSYIVKSPSSELSVMTETQFNHCFEVIP